MHSIRTYTWETTFVRELYSDMRLDNTSGKFESGLFFSFKRTYITAWTQRDQAFKQSSVSFQ